MKLEVLSYGEALEYVPKEKTYAIRIFNSLPSFFISDLIESDNWVGVKQYFFDDKWPRGWSEYDWVDTEDPSWSGALGWAGYLISLGNPLGWDKSLLSWDEIKKRYPEVTKKGLVDLMECNGYPYGRDVCFNEVAANRIYDDFEEFGGEAEAVMVHCWKGENRAPAVGMALNDLYGWGIEGLRERFPGFRRFVYETMMRVGEGRS